MKTQNTLYSRILILSILLIFILNINMTSAYISKDFVKDNDKATELTQYGTVTLKEKWFVDVFGWFEKPLQEITLLYNTDNCLINCKAGGTSTLYQKGYLFEDKKFITKMGTEINLDYQIYIKDIEYYEIEVPDKYKQVCELIKSNGTELKNNETCWEEVDSYKKEIKEREVWKEYNKELLDAGFYEWELRAKKHASLSVDWIVTANSKELKEWAWWNGDWTHKKAINISETTGNEWTNYSVLLNVTYESNMQTDFDDLRFLNLTEDGELPYWIESKVDGASAMVWVKTPLTASVNTSIYMYYGNTGASTTSNGTKSFMLYDYGDVDRSDRFICTATQTVGYSNGEYTLSSEGGAGAIAGWKSCDFLDTELASNVTMTAKIYAGTSYFGITTRSGTGTVGNDFYRTTTFDTTTFRLSKFVGGSETHLETIGSISVAGWQTFTLSTFGTNITGQVGTTISSKLDTSISTAGRYGFNIYETSSGWKMDNITVRQYGTPEPTATFGAEESSEGISITLNSPEDNLNYTTSEINFNATITPANSNITNTTLLINGVEYFDEYNTNETLNYFKVVTLADGSYTWNVTACWIGESETESCTESATRTLTIDTTAPIINITNPTAILDYGAVNQTFNLSWEVTDSNLDSLWYDYNGTIVYVSGATNSTLITIDSYANRNLTFYANDSVGNEAEEFKSWDYKFFTTSETYNENALVSGIETFNLVGITNTAQVPIAYLNYNGTETLATRTGTTTNHNFTVTKTIIESGNMSFFWRITYGTEEINTTANNQIVTDITSMNVTRGACASGLTSVMTFNFKDEINLTALTNVKVDYNFQYGTSNSTGKTFFGTLSNLTTMNVCLNTTQSPTYTLGYGEIQYSLDGYTDRRFYVFENTRVSNVTINTTLYSLPTASSTSFLIGVRSPDLVPYVGIYTTLLRWYPELNEYIVVEMGKTDDKGETVKKIKIEDVDYRIGIYYTNGSLIYLANPIRMVCLSSPCSYTINVPSDVSSLFDEVNGIETLIEYDYDTGIFTLTYNDPSQNTEIMTLRVYKLGEITDSVICETNGTAFTGVLSCNVSGSTGTLKAVALRTASPLRILSSLIIDTATTIFQSKFGLFLQFIIIVTLAFLGIVSPVVSIIMALLALGFGVFLFKTVSYALLVGVAVLGGIVIHLMRRTN